MSTMTALSDILDSSDAPDRFVAATETRHRVDASLMMGSVHLLTAAVKVHLLTAAVQVRLLTAAVKVRLLTASVEVHLLTAAVEAHHFLRGLIDFLVIVAETSIATMQSKLLASLGDMVSGHVADSLALHGTLSPSRHTERRLRQARRLPRYTVTVDWQLAQEMFSSGTPGGRNPMMNQQCDVTTTVVV